MYPQFRRGSVNAILHLFSAERSAGPSLDPSASRSSTLGAEGVRASRLATTQPEVPPGEVLDTMLQ
jgi:hypothetical protein